MTEKLVLIKALDHSSFEIDELEEARGEDYLIITGYIMKEDDKYYYIVSAFNEIDKERQRLVGFKVLKSAVVELRELCLQKTDKLNKNSEKQNMTLKQ